MIDITISIPAYNEEQNIATLLSEINELKKQLSSDIQIVVINDGSTDNTLAIIDSLFASSVKVINHKKNLGFGATIKEVFTVPTSEWILFLSGDNQFPATNLITMLPYTKEYHYILGYRTERADTVYRKNNSKLYNHIISLIGKKRVRDVNSIVLLKKEIINSIQLRSNSAFIHAEIYLKALQQQAKIIEVPIIHNERSYGEASGGKISTILFTIFELIKYLFGRI